MGIGLALANTKGDFVDFVEQTIGAVFLADTLVVLALIRWPLVRRSIRCMS